MGSYKFLGAKFLQNFVRGSGWFYETISGAIELSNRHSAALESDEKGLICPLWRAGGIPK